MRLYHFVLWLENEKEITADLEKRVIEAGCDDALLARVDGSVFLEFDREEESLLKAVSTAIRDAAKAGCRVRRIGMYDLVNDPRLPDVRAGRGKTSISSSKGYAGKGISHSGSSK